MAQNPVSFTQFLDLKFDYACEENFSFVACLVCLGNGVLTNFSKLVKNDFKGHMVECHRQSLNHGGKVVV
jgi:hypothetical protein